MRHASEEDLLGLARGDLPQSEARAIEEHAAGCTTCGRELAWLRTERGLVRARTPIPVPTHTWQAIERRIIVAREQRRGERRRMVRGGGIAVGFAAAASLLIWVWGHGVPSLSRTASQGSATAPTGERRDEQPASTVLDDAERQYRTAIQTLEVAYANERDALDPDTADRYEAEFRRLRDVLSTEQAAAQCDVWARRRVLRAYSAYMHSMQAVVLEVRK
jgi:hypothetical protein